MPKHLHYFDGKSYQLESHIKRPAEKGEYILADEKTGEVVHLPGKTPESYYIYKKLSDSKYIIQATGKGTRIFDMEKRKTIINVYTEHSQQEIAEQIRTILLNSEHNGQEKD